MTRRTQIPGARSYKKGQLSQAELVAMAKEFSDDAVRAQALEEAEDPESYALDAILVDGDVVISGDLDTGDTGDEDDGDAEGTLLVVRGNLTVRGLYRDTCNDAPDKVLILGNLIANNIITASFLEVRGNLIAEEVLVGDFNDGGAQVRGDLAARLFAPLDHSFRVGGAIRTEYYVEGSNEVDARTAPTPIDWSEAPLEELDPDDVIQRLRAHEPVLRRK